MAVKNKPIINNVPPVPDADERDRIWKTVVQTKETVGAQCFSGLQSTLFVPIVYPNCHVFLSLKIGAFPDNNELYKYWGVNEEKYRHTNRTHHSTLTVRGNSHASHRVESGNIYAQTPYDRAMR